VITYSSAVTIERPPGDVFRYLLEPEKQALWSDVPMRRLTEGPFGVGTRIEVAFGRGPLHVTVNLEVVGLDTDRRFAFKSDAGGPLLWDGEYRLEPTGSNGTRISQSGTVRFIRLWRLLEPFVGAEIRSGEIKELEKLKAVVEAGQ
jgi:uncharacterized protein YndB with AHSA1/START domain